MRRTMRRGETIFANGAITARTKGRSGPSQLEDIMNQLGHTRSAHHRDHLLQTPDTFVRAPLPGMDKVTAIVHVRLRPAPHSRSTPLNSKLAGVLEPGPLQRFVYVLEGELEASGKTLSAGGFLYCPPGHEHRLQAVAPRARRGHRKTVSATRRIRGSQRIFADAKAKSIPQPLLGDPALEVRALVPADAALISRSTR